MNLLFRHIAEAHAHITVHRIYTSFNTIQMMCNLCRRLEKLFVGRKLQPTGGSMVGSYFFQNRDVTCLFYPGKISNCPLEFEKSSYSSCEQPIFNATLMVWEVRHARNFSLGFHIFQKFSLYKKGEMHRWLLQQP